MSNPQIAVSENEFAQRIADDAIYFERTISVPIDRVWASLTTAEGLRKWIGAAKVEPCVGGAFILQLTDDVEMRGHILELEPPKRIVIYWREISEGAPSEYGTTPDFHSELIFTLAPIHNGTQLTLTHRLIRGGEVMTSFAGGWHAFLTRLDDVLRGESGLDAMAIYERVKPLYDRRFSATSG
jgi:uncharacterized protein YndB with AHSA1/START domain